MLSHLILPTLSLLPALPLTAAQGAPAMNYYTVWSSVIFTRTGDRTPVSLTNEEPTLTTLGAAQAYNAGAFMASRYFGEYTTNGVGTAHMPGLSVDNIDVQQMFIGAPAEQFAIGTAQAFMQGFYSPFNSTSTLANATQIAGPLGGYQYPMIQTYGGSDPESIFLNGQSNCPAFNAAVDSYENSPSSLAMSGNTQSVYQTVGEAMLQGVLPPDQWNSQWAWPIWDYVNYQNTHFSNASVLFTEDKFFDQATNTSYLDLLRWYSDQQLNGWLGNPYAANPSTSAPFSAESGSISTIGGNFLASQILGQLQQAIKYKSEYYKLSLLFGDFQPLTSLFALLDMSKQNPMFLGIPDFASTVVFELWSISEGGANVAFPENEDELYVRFSFRNGTEGNLTGYSIFGYDPSEFDLSWATFSSLMYNLAPGNASNWCTECNADSIFCAYSDASKSLGAGALIAAHRPPVSPVLAGVIGALVALVFATIIFGIVMLVAGVRFHRVYSRKNSEVGGYKGSRKLASDKDLVIPKGGVASVVTTEAEDNGGTVRGGHERVGSWELKQSAPGSPEQQPPPFSPAPQYQSFAHQDEHDIGEAPWQKPVVPDERV